MMAVGVVRSQLSVVAFVLVTLAISLLSFVSPRVGPPPAGGKAVRDMAGREIHLSLPALRVITLAPVLSAYTTIDGGAEHVLAAADAVESFELKGPHAVIYPDLYQVKSAGPIGPSDPERIMVFHPDAVFAWNTNAQSLPVVGLPGLIEIGMNIWDPSRQIDDRLALWRLIGRTADRSKRTEVLIDRYTAELTALQTLLPDPNQHKLRVLILRGVAGAWVIESVNYNFDYALAFMRAENAAQSRRFSSSPRVDVERLLLLQPDIILLDPFPENHFPNELYCQRALSVVRAVRERKVYAIPHFADYMDPVDDPLFLRWMAEVFYPQRLACELRPAVREAYRSGYHYDMRDDEIDRLLMVKANAQSAGYERFSRACIAATDDSSGSRSLPEPIDHASRFPPGG